jgi:hypothetical protein
MAQAISNPTATMPGCGVETHTPAVENSRKPAQSFIVWLPALFILIGMPILALITTKYCMLPWMKRVYTEQGAANAGYVGSQDKGTVYFARLPFDSGVKGAHTGITSVALVGRDNAFKDKVDQNKAKLTELTAVVLKGKTVSDLDKPGALDATRAKLLTAFNRALGEPVVQEVYISEGPGR